MKLEVKGEKFELFLQKIKRHVLIVCKLTQITTKRISKKYNSKKVLGKLKDCACVIN